MTTDFRTQILHAIILLAVIGAALVLALTGHIEGGLAIGVVVAAAGIAAPSPFGATTPTTSSTTTASSTPAVAVAAPVVVPPAV